MSRLAGLGIDRRAVQMEIIRQTGGGYNDHGEWEPVRDDPAPIRAVIQPMSGNQLMDVPEGVRTEAKWVCWSRSEISCDDEAGTFDRITHQDKSYRVLFVWPRSDGEFYRAALGKT